MDRSHSHRTISLLCCVDTVQVAGSDQTVDIVHRISCVHEIRQVSPRASGPHKRRRSVRGRNWVHNCLFVLVYLVDQRDAISDTLSASRAIFDISISELTKANQSPHFDSTVPRPKPTTNSSIHAISTTATLDNPLSYQYSSEDSNRSLTSTRSFRVVATLNNVSLSSE